MDAAFLLTVGSFLFTELFDFQLTILALLLTVGGSLLTVLAFYLGSGCGTAGKSTGQKWTKMVQTTILVKVTLFRTGFLHSRDQNGPFWPEEVHFGPFRSVNRTLVIPDTYSWSFLLTVGKCASNKRLKRL